MRGIKTDVNRTISGASSQMIDKKVLLDKSNKAIGLAARSPHGKLNQGTKSKVNLNETAEYLG